MFRAKPLATLTVAALLTATLAACSSSATDTEANAGTTSGDTWTPVTIEHALGKTVIEKKPERVATVNWANHEVPLALGIVPVGMAAANFGDDDTDGLLPWVKKKLDDLKAPTPVLFDETDGVDFAAVADTKPDVILASYSGLTQQDYDTLSQIAPVVAYPEAAWATPWQDIIKLNSKALGKAAEGDKLIADIQQQVKTTVAKYPQLAGKSAMFVTHIDPSDVSQIGYYTTHDTRTLFFEDLGLTTPASVAKASADTKKFSLKQSSEQIDFFNDVDIITGYGDADGKLLQQLQSDPLLSKIPAVQRGSVTLLPGSTPLATAANPTPLAISWVLEDYVKLLAAAADKVK
ncbi:iron-siderophore ABC transporter substrate-binding protein [Rhodococcus sp. X156]|uniref:iron-siderophore ABC transporter substrate-binding protein n=1 Tax=Rhodococcus sp. X156 TaxID=2499145 RepID=UPI000FD74378|nr:iron-siderophore ABC transporter substrate-binding protein [Rhodococcus sp. X156]